MLLSTRVIFLLPLLLILSLHTHPLSASNRRILHHPLLLSPLSPSEPPLPSPLHHRVHNSLSSVITSAPQPTLSTPDYTDLPFFPTYSPPPPPPPPPPPVLTSIPTFPANVSSLALPTTSAPSHSYSAKLIILVLAAVVALVSLLVFVLVVRRKSGRGSSELRPLYPHDAPTSDGRPPPLPPQPKLPSASQTSSEFLYLGTVSAETSEFQVRPTVPTTSSFPEVVDERVYHLKLCGSGSSPELKPLPPLPRSSEFFRLGGDQGGVSETTIRGERFFHVNNNNNVEEFFSPSNSSRHEDDEDYFNNSGLKSCFSSSCHGGSPSNNSPGRDSDDVSVEIQALAEKAEFFPAPPPPPPQATRLSAGPPTLVPPSGPVVMKRSGNLSKSGERCEESNGIKPKLKALYWDKVRASSDRVTVWDQLHPGSFK